MQGGEITRKRVHMIDPSGAVVFWDYQIGTFSGAYQDQNVGLYAGHITSVAALEAALGVTLSAETGAALQEDMLKAPFLGNRLYCTKLQFMDLFQPASLEAIYTAAKTYVAVQIELDRVNRAPNDRIELSDPRTLAGLLRMEATGLVPPGDALRISKGLPWQQ